jgi:two-component system, OmpR family, sensor kinase
MIPRGLRAQLVLSFAAIILLCLCLAGSAFAYLLQPYQTQQALNRLATLAVPLAVQVRILEIQGATTQEIGAFLDDQADDLNVRVLLLRQNTSTVIHDTGSTLNGRTLTFEATRPNDYFNPVMQGTADIPGEGEMVIVAVPSPPTFSAFNRDRPRLTPESRQYSVAIAAPTTVVGAEWIQVARRLGMAGLISIIASIGVALVLARSISEPIGAITRASEAMARGDYNQKIETRGNDEIARLASAFNDMAEQVAKSNQTLRAFLADVSHELRTPLTTIEGFSEAILDGTARDRESIIEAARIIKEDATRMERLVEDLLDLSKIESGQTPMETSLVDLDELVDGAVKRARVRLDGRELQVDASREAKYVTADARRLGQVLDNLLNNAIHHTPDGGQITVSSAARNGEVSVRVHNTGSWVRPEDRDRIFQRFFRGSSDGNGAGLGLAISSDRGHRIHPGPPASDRPARAGQRHGRTPVVLRPAPHTVFEIS